MEVLIAVIILGFSMSIVFYALQNISDTQCVAQLKAQTTALQNALLDVALGSPPTNAVVSYNLPVCAGKSVEAIRFVKYTDPSYCRLCPGQYGSCWIIEPTVYDYQAKAYYTLADASVCVNMPAAIDLQPIDSTVPNAACRTDPLLNGRFSQNPCPPSVASCPASVSGVPTSVYNPSAPTSSSNLFWTFGRTSSDPRAFVFELSKVAAASQAGIIQICTRRSVS